jgi:hypothetical protein
MSKKLPPEQRAVPRSISLSQIDWEYAAQLSPDNNVSRGIRVMLDEHRARAGRSWNREPTPQVPVQLDIKPDEEGYETIMRGLAEDARLSEALKARHERLRTGHAK